MTTVLLRKFRTLLNDPRAAILSPLKRAYRRHAQSYLASEGVNAHLYSGRSDEIHAKPADLWHLHWTIRRRRPKVVLEFGVGFSTIAMAHALMLNFQQHGVEGHLWSVDTSSDWLANTRTKLGPELGRFVTLQHSRALATEIGGELCHVYESLPDVNPDLVLLDGPAPEEAEGDVRGLSFHHGRPPLSADPLLLEAGLQPGFLMIVDGRYANVRFLRRRLQRRYRFRWNRALRYSTFELVE